MAMKYRDVERGIDQDDTQMLERVIAELETEIKFLPGSADRTTIKVDTLVQLIRAAKDGLTAYPLFEALEPASEELEQLQREHVSSTMGKVMARYLDLHPELND